VFFLPSNHARVLPHFLQGILLSLYIEAANFMPPVFFIKKLLEKTTAIEEMVSTSKPEGPATRDESGLLYTTSLSGCTGMYRCPAVGYLLLRYDNETDVITRSVFKKER
jgi:hypothetical protein